MNSALAERPSVDAGAIEQALVGGDLSKLTPQQRVSYYNRVCESLGLNPLTKPFAYITLNGKLTLYALKDCTEQLRSNRNVSVQIVAREVVEDCYVVTARASMPLHANERQSDLRTDESLGAVPLAGLKGEARANAMMKAETKAKRRVTLSICGLGMLDETEVETIHPAPGYTIEAPAPSVNPSPMVSVAALPSAGGTAAYGPSAPNGGGIGHDYATTQNTAPAPELPEGTVRIERVDTSPTKNPNVTKFFITLSTGEQVSTIREPLGKLCEQLVQENLPVTVETKKSKWGTDLIAVHRIPAPEFAPVEPTGQALHGEQIPF